MNNVLELNGYDITEFSHSEIGKILTLDQMEMIVGGEKDYTGMACFAAFGFSLMLASPLLLTATFLVCSSSPAN